MAKAKTPCCIEWRLSAREDLRAIVTYIGRDNPNGARSFGHELRDRTKPLARHPQLGRTGQPGLPVHSLPSRAVADATLLVAFFMMTARFLETLAVEFDEVA